MSSYARDEVVGRNGRIFQGPCTDQRSVMEIREAIREERSIQISLLNYRKDGTPLWMLFHMSPVFDQDGGAVAHLVAVQVPISRRWRRSCSANGRNGVNLCEEVCGALRDVVLGSCRREVCSDGLAELGRISAFGSVLDSDSRGVEAEEPCEASDSEKQRAASAISQIMSCLLTTVNQPADWFVGKDANVLDPVLSVHLYLYLLVESNKALYCEFLQVPNCLNFIIAFSCIDITDSFILALPQYVCLAF
ncbi:hypothetical protein BT93_L1344 [Corymbia citriodora subsp. variegata]|uniref:PAC domain-containing protein n=1 Tax=Corymbia citriodora subsp. variegata TaxID=360336 RepID=A0A8T0CN53_CORYI|nr:hypothetical protein BT93_L1344 [Corymbia citriodora subsp. variegata]